MWCRQCGALIGLRQPLEDWSTERTGVCPTCAVNMMRSRETQQDLPITDVRMESEKPTGEPG
jgi:hypothetical protein